MASRSEYEELLILKSKLKIALDIDDYDAVRDIYSRIKVLYKKVTGKNFEEKISEESLKKIRSIINKNTNTNEVDNKKLEY